MTAFNDIQANIYDNRLAVNNEIKIITILIRWLFGNYKHWRVNHCCQIYIFKKYLHTKIKFFNMI